VAFPEEVLADTEEVVLHLRPHWKTVLRPVLLVLLAVVVTTVAWVMLPTDRGGRIGFVVVALIMLYQATRYGLRPLVIWRCTHYVLTDERILLQDGVVARERRDLPLNRINDHALNQSLLDRMFGCGMLTVDSIGDQVAVLVAVPRAQQVQTLLYELIEQDRLNHPDDEDDEEEPDLPAQRRGIFRRPAAGLLLRAQFGEAGHRVQVGQFRLVAVDRRLEEDERPVRPEAEQRADHDADAGHAEDGEPVVLLGEAEAVLADRRGAGLEGHADQVEAEEQRVLPAQRGARVMTVGPVPVREVRQCGGHDRGDDTRLDRSDRQRHPGDEEVEHRVAGTDDAERGELRGEMAQLGDQRTC
jgi:membrane protein YdbS with pleckstrin-like domain